MNEKKRFDTVTLVELALMIAVVCIMGLTPLGTIRTPFLSVSIVTVGVAIGAILIGPMGGLICGTAFGVTSFINAITGASGMMSILLGISPLAAAFTCLVPRMLDGLCTGLIFQVLHKFMDKPAYFLASVCAPLLNTLFFMTSLIVFYYNTDYVQGLVEKVGATNPFNFVILLVGVQGIIEACTALVLGGIISFALSKALKRH